MNSSAHSASQRFEATLKLLSLVVVVFLLTASGGVAGGFVYENPNEFLATGDFNGDGATDILILDKQTGNARVGYANTNGVLTWSQPLASGVQNITGCAAGRFFALNLDALAVTATTFNRVNLLDLSATNSTPAPTIITPTGIGPYSLVTLDPPTLPPPTSYASLLVDSELNDNPSDRLELLNFAQGVPSAGSVATQSTPYDRPNALKLASDGAALAVGLVRDATDTCLIWEFTNTPAIIAGVSNLPPASDYVFGNFNSEALPRFVFYQPGGTNLLLFPLVAAAGGLAFGQPLSVTLTQAVQQVYYLTMASDGALLLQYGDGIQGLRLPGGTPVFSPRYSSGAGAGGNAFTGVVPFANGQFALLDAPKGSLVSVHSQVLSFDGANFNQVSTSILPALSSPSTRANVWLFQSEPFVNRNPGFIESLTAADWSDGVSGLPGSVTVVRENDGGLSVGLSATTTNNLGTAPVGTAYGLPNQYAPAISVFTFSGAKPAEPVIVSINPPPGPYASPIQISFSVLNGGIVSYRVGPTDTWHAYNAPFPLTNEATILFYGTSPSLARSQIQSASYTFGGQSNPTAAPPIDTIPGDTNAPPSNTNTLVLSTDGTAFYGRRSVGGVGTIWAINLDGSGDTPITTGARPRVSRDGRWMAFLREGNPFGNQANLWLRDLLTGQETRLLVNTNAIVSYDWRLDNSSLVIDYSCALWILSTNGILAPLLSADCSDKAPAISPVDGRIAFHNLSTNVLAGGIYLAAADGTGRQRIVTNITVNGASWPQWSPDGQHLVFVDHSSGLLGNGTNLWLTDLSGTNLTLLTGFIDGTNHFQNGALWSPNGMALVGAGTVFGTNGLWIVPVTPDLKSCDCPPRLLPTTPGDPIDFAGSIVVAPTTRLTAGAAPGLFIRQDQGAVVVYWNTNAPGYTLESSAGLTTPPIWGPVTGPFYLVDTNFEYWESYQSLLSEKYFRLHFTGSLIISQPR